MNKIERQTEKDYDNNWQNVKGTNVYGDASPLTVKAEAGGSDTSVCKGRNIN